MCSDKSTASSMKIETLVFIVCLLRGHSGATMRPHVAALMPAVLASVHDPFYKVTAEALRVLQTLVKVMRPLGNYLRQAALRIVMLKYTKMFMCTFLSIYLVNVRVTKFISLRNRHALSCNKKPDKYDCCYCQLCNTLSS